MIRRLIIIIMSVPRWMGRFFRRWQDSWFLLSAGGILALAGANRLLDACGGAQAWDLKDPITGVPWRYLVLTSGLAELCAAWFCLFTHKRKLSLGLASFIALTFAGYRIGLWCMDWPHPWVFVGSLTDAWNMSPLLADGLLGGTALYLLLGGVILFILPHEEQEMPAPLLAARPKASPPPLPKTLPPVLPKASPETLPATPPQQPEQFKVHCPSCGGKTAFTAERLGQTIACPHCGVSFPLNKPT